MRAGIAITLAVVLSGISLGCGSDAPSACDAATRELQHAHIFGAAAEDLRARIVEMDKACGNAAGSSAHAKWLEGNALNQKIMCDVGISPASECP